MMGCSWQLIIASHRPIFFFFGSEIIDMITAQEIKLCFNFTETLKITTTSNPRRISVEFASNPRRNDFDVESTELRRR